MKNLKYAILNVLSPRMIGIYPETLKSEVALNLKNLVMTTGEYTTALAELKEMGYVLSLPDCMGELTYISTEAGRGALAASGRNS